MDLRSPAKGVTEAELREARRGFTLMLRRKRFSPRWIEENVNDLLAQASSEYAEKLGAGLPADNPIGWLINCAWRRNQNLLDAQRRKPRPSSLDAVFHLADESTPTPDQQAIETDRQERLHEALSFLPEKECKLLALVYFEDNSIREAGRKLGWQKSAADRHHNTAMEKLRALVGDDRSLLSPATLGLGAAVAARGGASRLSRLVEVALTPIREGIATGAEVMARAAGRLAELGRTCWPLSEQGGAAISAGAGRAIGICAAGVLTFACGFGAVGAIGPGLSGSAARPHPSPGPPTVRRAARPTSPSAPAPQLPLQESPEPEPPEVSHLKPRTAKRARAVNAPKAPTNQIGEFGVESGSGSPPAVAESSESSDSVSQASSGASASAPKQGGTSSASEFGL